jgi:clathrin heavy chain
VVSVAARASPRLPVADRLSVVVPWRLQLTAFGIQPASIGFNSLTLESDRFICIREDVSALSLSTSTCLGRPAAHVPLQNNGQKTVIIVDLNDASNVIRRPISAESAIMHPKEKILALRAQRQLQIFNIELKQKVKSHLMHDDIVFWKWISDTSLGIVTESAVYHWNGTSGTDPPAKVFDRHVSLSGNQIINYRVNGDEKWLAVVGISSNQNPAGFKVKGAIQLYSQERGVSQPIEGHAACFAEIRLDGSPVDTKLFAFAVRTAQGAKVSLFGVYPAYRLRLYSLCIAAHCRDRPQPFCARLPEKGRRRIFPARSVG